MSENHQHHHQQQEEEEEPDAVVVVSGRCSAVRAAGFDDVDLDGGGGGGEGERLRAEAVTALGAGPARPAAATASGRPQSADRGSLKERLRRLSSVRKRGYEVVSVQERHGDMRRAIPVLPLPLAVICCILNCLLPGVGTLAAGFSVLIRGYPTEHESRVTVLCWSIFTAILQMITTLVLLGWIWSIRWGIIYVQLSNDVRKEKERIYAYARRSSSIR